MPFARRLLSGFAFHGIDHPPMTTSCGRFPSASASDQGQQNPAVTYFISQGYTDLPFRAFLVKPYSGKTHQIRVALKSQGAAILGDSQYQGSAADRVYLHAYALRFNLSGQCYCYVRLPGQGIHFLQLLDSGLPQDWAKPWLLSWPAYTLPQKLSN